MSPPKKARCIIPYVILLSWVVVAYVAPDYMPGDQGVRNAAAKPLFEAVVTRKLKVGDSLEHVKEVLEYAGLSHRMEQWGSRPPWVVSIYRASRYSGFGIRLELDGTDCVSKIEIKEYFTGL
jgi:hypothetical protein